MIAIHNSEGFAPRWINFCKRNSIQYKVVCCYDDDIVMQLKGCQALMWHHQQTNIKDVLTAKRILYSLQHTGIHVFPDFNTAWHFDDKVAQKYLLELLEIPHVKSYIFYDKSVALDFMDNCDLPIVFKLKGGAGAVNVQLINSRQKGRRIIKKLFGNGYPPVDILSMVKDRFRLLKLNRNKKALRSLFVAVYRLFRKNSYQKFTAREGGYFYAQEFLPGNTFDIRIIIVNQKAIAIRRDVRPNDFRASGSGLITPLDDTLISKQALSIAFSAYQKINGQSIAFDFVTDKEQKPLIIEISYGFVSEVYESCRGYWTSDLQWHEDANISKLQEEMVIQVCNQCNIDFHSATEIT